MQTSDKGIAFLERHEGVVLKAYRDPVGIWTIGAGLTAASGVVKPSAGMTITADEASALTRKALTANYEPAVEAAMPGAEQHEFDAGVSFHWNTGAIGRASWVRAWRIKAWEKVQAKLALWSKAKGRVLAGLKRRRDEEFKLLRFGIYERHRVQPAERSGAFRCAGRSGDDGRTPPAIHEAGLRTWRQ